jgi:radical SAM protein with 4Fe4S-binding SPASM domain
LREDTNKVFLHKLSLDEVKFLILPPHIGVIVPLFDGKRTLAEVAVLLGMIFGETDEEQCLALCREALEFVNHDEKKVIPVRLINTPIVTYTPEDFAVDLRQYQFSHRLNKPFRAMVFPSNLCHTNCMYCYAERRVCKELTLDEWNRIIEEMKKLKFYVIDITGGDPLARNDGISLLEDFIRANLLFMISTKCLVKSNDAKRLVDAGFCKLVNGVSRKFQVSLDAVDPEIAALMTGRRGYLSRAKTTISNLLEAGISPQIKAVMTPYNWWQVELLVETFLPQGVKQFAFSVYGRSGYRHDDKFFLTSGQKVAIAEVCSKIKSKYPEIELTGDAIEYDPGPKTSKERKKRWKSRAGCSGGFVSIGIAPDGNVILCEQVPQRPPFLVGDLRRQSIMEVWESDNIKNFLHPDRQLFTNTICYDCDEFEPCHYEKGWCYRDALFAFGSPYTSPPDCPRVKLPPRMR